MAYYCYILECADGSYYIGWSTDPERRLKQHNAGRGARYTRSRRPAALVYTEEHPNRAAAMQREFALKRLNRARKRALINQFASEKNKGKP
jgi:putative endonuclease